MHALKIIIILLFVFVFLSTYPQNAQSAHQQQTDTIIYQYSERENCPALTDTIIYTLLKCGLYISNKGDICYKSLMARDDVHSPRQVNYIHYIWGADRQDTLNGGIREMKDVIDTATLHCLDGFYWIDKRNMYSFTPTSDGGSIKLMEKVDRASFRVLENSGYAKDKRHAFYHGIIIKGADAKSFRLLDKGENGLARDKKNTYQDWEIYHQ